MTRILSLLPVLVLLGPAPALAASWLVPSQVGTIEAAFDSAASGDTVVVASGTYFEHDLVLKSGVTLRSETGDPADVTIDAQQLGRLFQGVGLSGGRLVGLTLTNGDAPTGTDDAGGAIRLENSSLDITDCVFTGNVAQLGGALALIDSSPTVDACEFTGNHGTGNGWGAGGAINILRASPVVRGCTFTGNTATAVTAPGDGGAIFAKASTTLVEDCMFLQNTSEAGAGAAYSWEGDLSVYRRCTFQENTSTAGGAMYLETSQATLDDCDFVANSAANGGALFMDQFSSPVIVDCRFTNNVAAPNAGGAVDAWATTPDIRRCTFIGNTAARRGGALSFNGESDALVEECVFVGNSAVEVGGAIRAAWTAIVRVAGTTIVESEGGGISAQDGAQLFVDHSIIAFGSTGTAVSCTETSTATVADSDLFGNAGGDWVDCVAGQSGTNGNFSADPLFCDRAGGDYTLTLPDSPCLPANAPSGMLVGRYPGGCGCPLEATILVPSDHPTIGAALAAAVPGDVVGLCEGTYTETVTVKPGVHLVGTAAALSRVEWPGGPHEALLHASGVADSTVVSDITFDGRGLARRVVLAESGTTGLHLQRNVITGGRHDGIVNSQDSFARIGGAVEFANDIFGNGGASPRNIRNLNDTADSLDAVLNYWGTMRYDSILASVEGKVRTCPITDSTHTSSLCAPVCTVSARRLGHAAVGLSVRPNPFRGSCRITLAIREPTVVELIIFDVRGRRVAALHRGRLPVGSHALRWGGRDAQGRPVAPGIYFLRLETGAGIVAQKLVHVR